MVWIAYYKTNELKIDCHEKIEKTEVIGLTFIAFSPRTLFSVSPSPPKKKNEDQHV